ncbi:MAG: aldolase/citrate lyase family protein [Coriobacteriia bacterium]
MPLKLMYITNEPWVAQIAQASGVDRVFIDLEVRGKSERQGHLDTVISRHALEDVAAVRGVLDTSELLVRVNPIHGGSADEIERVIAGGADVVMLPFFKTATDVDAFVTLVSGRARVCLLVETPEAVDAIDEILTIEGVDEAHIGLNDLHLGYGMTFMFELLADGTVERLCRKFAARGLRYGFGGIARLGQGALAAEMVITEHYRLGSQMAILSRSFCDMRRLGSRDELERLFMIGVEEIRAFESGLRHGNPARLEENRVQVARLIAKMVTAHD